MAGSNQERVVCVVTSVHRPTDPRVFLKQAQSLARAGYRVLLVAQHDIDEVIGGVAIRSLRRPRNRLGRILGLSWSAFHRAMNEKADVYHFHDPELIPLMLLVKILRRVPIIYDVHEDYVTSVKQKTYLPRFVRRPLAQGVAAFEWIAARAFTIILAERYYAERFPQGTTVLNYPVLCKQRQTGDSPAFSAEQPRVLYTGNVTEDRGALIHAGLVHLLPHLHVHVVGHCSPILARQMYDNASPHQERLHIEGVGAYVPHEQIESYYRTPGWLAGLALFPATDHYRRKELTKLFEYMAAGLPVIASSFPAWRDIVEGNGCGIVVDPLDSEAVVSAIQQLLDHPDKTRQMADNGRRAVQQQYNWSHEEKKLLDLYERLVGD
jgi:glycosyltransferase involved in cell wall biosynthesis